MQDTAHRTRLLNRLSSAISRCRNKNNAAYKHYGERGITVYQPWIKNRTAFLEYIQTLDGWDIPELEMDRTNVNLGYIPGNIRFITQSQNLCNKRKVYDLEKEISRLRLELRRAKQQILRINQKRPTNSS